MEIVPDTFHDSMPDVEPPEGLPEWMLAEPGRPDSTPPDSPELSVTSDSGCNPSFYDQMYTFDSVIETLC